jgi:hypothetical protein
MLDECKQLERQGSQPSTLGTVHNRSLNHKTANIVLPSILKGRLQCVAYVIVVISATVHFGRRQLSMKNSTCSVSQACPKWEPGANT